MRVFYIWSSSTMRRLIKNFHIIYQLSIFVGNAMSGNIGEMLYEIKFVITTFCLFLFQKLKIERHHNLIRICVHIVIICWWRKTGLLAVFSNIYKIKWKRQHSDDRKNLNILFCKYFFLLYNVICILYMYLNISVIYFIILFYRKVGLIKIEELKILYC